jgi:hypothetical protein
VRDAPDSIRDGALSRTKGRLSRLNTAICSDVGKGSVVACPMPKTTDASTNHYQPGWLPEKSGLTITLCFSQSMPVAPAPGPS